MKNKKMKGYNEFVSHDGIGFILNCFGHILYTNTDWPNGEWEKSSVFGRYNTSLSNEIKRNCKKGRSFNKEELVLEVL